MKNNKQASICDQETRKKQLAIHLMIFFIGATLFLLLSPHQVSSLGVAPSLFNLDNPENVVDLRIRILNSQQEDLFVTIKPKGDLADDVILEQRTYRLSPQETEKNIEYKLRVRDDLPPGQNVLNMYVVQLDEYSEGDDIATAELNAKVSVVQRVNINIPYPGEYLTGNLFVQASTLQEPIDFLVHLINKGDKEVSAQGKITIKGSTNQIITTLIVPETIVKANQDIKVPLKFIDMKNSGEYLAEVYMQYGEQQLFMKKTFTVGNKLVTAYNLVIERFSLGEIVKVGIDVTSEWNQLIESITARGKVIDPQTGEQVSSFETTPIDLPAQGVARIDAYWDTQGLAPGAYDIDVQLHYDDQITQNFFDTIVSIDAIQISKQGLTGQVISGSMKKPEVSEPTSNQTLNILVLLVIFLIIAVIILFIKMSKKK